MKQQSSFVGWDFVGETANGTEDIWSIDEGVSFPKLAWQSAIELPVEFLIFPIAGLSHNTASISAVFDHNMTAANAPGTGVIAYDGEAGTIKDTSWSFNGLYGYKKADGTAFMLNGHYTGGSTLFYEGHTGYDFPYGHSYEVVAAAGGVVHKLNDASNQIWIDHGNGYSTWYLHMLSADTAALVDGVTTVTQGQHLGYCGNYYNTSGGVPYHLHFTVKKGNDRVDPYGWSGPGEDPYYTRFGVHNLVLWASAQISVTKCTVTAGSKDSSDKISFSGTMDATADDLSATSSIEVTIDSDDMVNPCVLTFPINDNTFKNDKYNYSGTENGVRKSFTYDIKTGKFNFAASNVDLSGLGCPVSVGIEIGDYNETAEIDETIVNGPKVPIPILLMMGVKDGLNVDKCQVKQNNKKPNSDQLSVNGAFAVEDTDMSMVDRTSEDLAITLGTQHFTIPADKLKAGKGKFTCTKADVTEDDSIAAATFNFNSCAFTLTIKAANIPAISGAVDFGVAFADFNEVEQITLP